MDRHRAASALSGKGPRYAKFGERSLGLLKSPAIVGSNGYITNFALLVVSILLVIAIAKAPVIFLGGGIAGVALKAGKMILKR